MVLRKRWSVHDQRPEDSEVLCGCNSVEAGFGMDPIQICREVHHVQVEHVTIEPPLKRAPSSRKVRYDGDQNSARTQSARQSRDDPTLAVEVLDQPKAIDDIELPTAKRVVAEKVAP